MGLFKRREKNKFPTIIKETIIEIDPDEEDSKVRENECDKNLSLNENAKEQNALNENNSIKPKLEFKLEKIFSLKSLPYFLSILSIALSLVGLFIALCGGNVGYIVFKCMAITSTLAALTTLTIDEIISKHIRIDFRYAFILVSLLIIIL